MTKIILDWSDSTHWNRGKQAACVHCSRPALLLDGGGRPAHKTCAEAVLAALINQRNERTPDA
jgi:hypothetical protein